jgi:hypothetical protein
MHISNISSQSSSGVYLFILRNLSSDKMFTSAKMLEYFIFVGEDWVNKIGKTHTREFQLNFDPERIQGQTITIEMV